MASTREDVDEIQDENDFSDDSRLIGDTAPDNHDVDEEKGQGSFPGLCPSRRRSTWSSFAGLFLALLSGILMTGYTALLKITKMDSMQIAVVRGVIQSTIMLGIALYKKMDLLGCREKSAAIILFLIAITGGARIMFIFISFARIPLGDAATILFSSPCLVMAFSPLLLPGERCGIFRTCAAIILFLGVVMISKPPILMDLLDPAEKEVAGAFNGSQVINWSAADSSSSSMNFSTPGHQAEATPREYDVLGYSLSLFACVMSAAGVLLAKMVSGKVEKVVSMMWLGVAGIVFGLTGLLSAGDPSLDLPISEWLKALAIGLLGTAQQYLVFYAIKLDSPARVTVVRSVQIIFAYAVQVLVFEQSVFLTDLVGAGIVMVVIVAVAFEKWFTGKVINGSVADIQTS